MMLGRLRSLSVAAIRPVRDVAAQTGDALRVLIFLLLRFAAACLPRSWAMGLADAAGLFLALTPVGARLRRSMAAAFPSADANRLAHEWLSRPFRDYITASRIAAQRDIPRDWHIESRGEPAILKEPGQSLIIATGHFSREAMTGVYLPKIIPKKLATVIASLDRTPGARALRVRVQLREMIAGIRRAREGDVEIVEVGGPRVVINLLKQLRQPGNVVVIATDAIWPRDRAGGLERPFAGQASQNFALGAARLARLSQCPIVTCVPLLNDRNCIVLEWGEPIPPPQDEDADARVTNAILDTLERAVGLRPGQYVHPIGRDRRWSPVAQCWIAAGEGERSPATAQVEAAAPRQAVHS